MARPRRCSSALLAVSNTTTVKEYPMPLTRSLRRISLSGSLLVALLLFLSSLPTGAALAATRTHTASATIRATLANADLHKSQAEQLRQMVRDGRLASTVHVLSSLAPTTIVQFPLVPSGIKALFPQASGLVTIIRGNRDNALADTVIVDVQNMPPNITFTIFYIQFAAK